MLLIFKCATKSAFRIVFPFFESRTRLEIRKVLISIIAFKVARSIVVLVVFTCMLERLIHGRVGKTTQ